MLNIELAELENKLGLRNLRALEEATTGVKTTAGQGNEAPRTCFRYYYIVAAGNHAATVELRYRPYQSKAAIQCPRSFQHSLSACI